MYLEIDEGFDSHPKTVRLCRVLGDVNAGQYLVRLWTWACRSAPDGDLSGMESGDLEAIMRYIPADGRLYAALTERWSPKFGPWLDREGDRLRLHGWCERQGAALTRMAKRAADMRSLRERRKAERDGHVAATLPERDTHVGDKTRQDQSRQDQSSDPDSCPAGRPPGRVGKVEPILSKAFVEFWKAYPRKVGKLKAWKAWPGDLVLPKILEALAWQIKTIDWTKERGTFVPHPATYLGQGRWEDEPTKATAWNAQPKQRDWTVGGTRAEECEHSDETGEVKL